MAPTSGIKVTDAVRNTYTRVFSGKKTAKLPYAVFKFNDDSTEIVVDYDEKFYTKQHTHNELIGLLPEDSPRFFCIDFTYFHDNQKKSVIMLFSWFPRKCSMKQKFIVGTSFLGLADALSVSKNKYMEGEEPADIDEAAVISNNKDWSHFPDVEIKPGPVNIAPISDDA